LKIWKYILPVERRSIVHLPRGAELLSLGEQVQTPVVWALVDPEQAVEPVIFRMVTTGEAFNPVFCTYVGTLTLGGWFVVHYFTQAEGLPQDDALDNRARIVEDHQQYRAEGVLA
jgi:hypothetical protein